MTTATANPFANVFNQLTSLDIAMLTQRKNSKTCKAYGAMSNDKKNTLRAAYQNINASSDVECIDDVEEVECIDEVDIDGNTVQATTLATPAIQPVVAPSGVVVEPVKSVKSFIAQLKERAANMVSDGRAKQIIMARQQKINEPIQPIEVIEEVPTIQTVEPVEPIEEPKTVVQKIVEVVESVVDKVKTIASTIVSTIVNIVNPKENQNGPIHLPSNFYRTAFEPSLIMNTSYYLTLNEVPLDLIPLDTNELRYITIDDVPKAVRGAFDDYKDFILVPELDFGEVVLPVIVCIDDNGNWVESYALVLGVV